MADKSATNSRVTTVAGDVVTVVRWTKRKGTDPVAARCEWVIDFGLVTAKELLEIATPEMVIQIQSDYRNGKVPAVGPISVREMLDRERTAFAATPESVKRQADKLNVEQKKALYEQLKAEMKALGQKS